MDISTVGISSQFWLKFSFVSFKMVAGGEPILFKTKIGFQSIELSR